jgi:hypothetical protein
MISKSSASVAPGRHDGRGGEKREAAESRKTDSKTAVSSEEQNKKPGAKARRAPRWWSDSR